MDCPPEPQPDTGMWVEIEQLEETHPYTFWAARLPKLTYAPQAQRVPIPPHLTRSAICNIYVGGIRSQKKKTIELIKLPENKELREAIKREAKENQAKVAAWYDEKEKEIFDAISRIMQLHSAMVWQKKLRSWTTQRQKAILPDPP